MEYFERLDLAVVVGRPGLLRWTVDRRTRQAETGTQGIGLLLDSFSLILRFVFRTGCFVFRTH